MTNELYLFFSSLPLYAEPVTTCRDRPLTMLAFVFQKTHTRSDIAMIKLLKLCILLWIH